MSRFIIASKSSKINVREDKNKRSKVSPLLTSPLGVEFSSRMVRVGSRDQRGNVHDLARFTTSYLVPPWITCAPRSTCQLLVPTSSWNTYVACLFGTCGCVWSNDHAWLVIESLWESKTSEWSQTSVCCLGLEGWCQGVAQSWSSNERFGVRDF